MTLVNEAVERIFAERKDFIIIGLTGRTGCGCTTVAKFLTKEFDVLQSPEATSITTIAARQNKILYEYAKETWESFHLIEMKHIIFTFVLEEDFKEFIKFINKFPEGKSQNLDNFENDFNNLHENITY